MKATNQKGFSVIEVVIVLVVLVLIGTLGYLFLSRQSETTTENGAASGSVKVETASILSDLDKVDVDKAVDTSTIDEALQ